MSGVVILMILVSLSSTSGNESITIPSLGLTTVTLYLIGLSTQLLSVKASQVISKRFGSLMH